MRLAPLSLGAIALLSALLGPASAHLGDIVYPIYELPTSDLPDLHDGTLADWEDALPGTSLDSGFFYESIGDYPDRDDLAFRAFLAWNYTSQRLYVGFERIDDVLIHEYPAPADKMWVMVDGDHSGGRFAGFPEDSYSEDERRLLTYAQAQDYLVYIDPPEEEQRLALQLVPPVYGWPVQSPWADIGTWQFGEEPNYSAIELSVTPWDELNWDDASLSRQSDLRPGAIIGFQIAFMDIDEGARIDHWQSLAPATYDDFYLTYEDAGFFVDGRLIPCELGDCSLASGASAVKPSSWGRIKASFR